MRRVCLFILNTWPHLSHGDNSYVELPCHPGHTSTPGLIALRVPYPPIILSCILHQVRTVPGRPVCISYLVSGHLPNSLDTTQGGTESNWPQAYGPTRACENLWHLQSARFTALKTLSRSTGHSWCILFTGWQAKHFIFRFKRQLYTQYYIFF